MDSKVELREVYFVCLAIILILELAKRILLDEHTFRQYQEKAFQKFMNTTGIEFYSNSSLSPLIDRYTIGLQIIKHAGVNQVILFRFVINPRNT